MPERSEPAWRLRVVEHVLLDPNELIAHPDNWRAHPDQQRQAMAGAIDELGFIGEVYVSKRSGRILDGHMRVALALKAKQHEVPVGYVDCADDAEEDRILASYDPIAALAVRDDERFGLLLERSPIANQALRGVLDGLIASPRNGPGGMSNGRDVDTEPVEVPEVWGVAVECTTEQEQLELLERLTEDGYLCRALLS